MRAGRLTGISGNSPGTASTEMHIRRVFRHGASYAVVVPRVLLEELHWIAGTHVYFEADGDGVRIRRAPELSSDPVFRKGVVNGKARIAARGRTYPR